MVSIQNKYFVTVCSVIEIVLCCGILFGWPNLRKVFERENQFITACENLKNISSNETELLAKCQDENLTAIFQYAAMTFSISAIFAGTIFDRYGTAIARKCGLVAYLMGNMLIIFSRSNDYLLYPGMCCLACCGIFLLTTQMQTANLFTDAYGKVLTLLNGSMDSSSSAALLVLGLYNAFGYQTCWIIYACLGVLVFLRTLLLLPKYVIPYPLPEGYTIHPPISCSDESSEFDDEDKNLEEDLLEESEPLDKLDEPNVPDFFSRDVFFSPLYISSVLFFIINVFRIYFFLGSMKGSTSETVKNSWNVTKEEADAEADDMATLFGLIQGSGILFATLNGVIIDKLMALTNCKFKTMAASYLCITSFGVVFSLILVLPAVKLQYGAYIFSVIHRAFTYGANAAIIGMCFPAQYFGKLFGFAQLCTVISSQMIGVTSTLASNSSYKKVNMVLLFLQISTIWHVFVMLFYSRKNAQSHIKGEKKVDETSLH